MRRFLPVLVVVATVAGLVGCDRATKDHAEKTLSAGGSEPVVGKHFELRYSQNHGFAFSVERFLPAVPPATMVVAIRTVMLLLMLGIWWTVRREGWWVHGAFALTLSGALGNLLDGFTRGYVVDFLHLRGWPIFNLADVYIAAGAGLLMLTLFRQSRGRDDDGRNQPA